MKLHSSCIWSVFLGRCHSFVKFNLPRANWRAPWNCPLWWQRWDGEADDLPMKLFEFGRVWRLRLSFGWGKKARLVSMVSMFHFHDLVRKNVKSRNLASSNNCTVEFKHIYTILSVFLLTWIFRFLRPWSRKVIEILWPSSSWHNEELQRLIQRFDSALDEADGGTSSDDCPMISEQKRGGVGMLVRVTWSFSTKSTTFSLLWTCFSTQRNSLHPRNLT